MIIGIDGNEANKVRSDIGARVGSNVVAYQIISALYKNRIDWKDKHKIKVYLSDEPLKDLPKEDPPHFTYEVLGNSPFWVLTKLMPKMFGKERPDVLHSPGHYLPIFSSVPMGCTIHDLGFLKFSEQFKTKDYWQLKYWTAKSINISKYIICVSKYTKSDLINYFPDAQEKVYVIHNSYDRNIIGKRMSKERSFKVLNRYKIDKDFILSLGTLKPSKNIVGLIEAFAKLNNKNIQLVISGGKGWMYEEIKSKVKALRLTKRVIFTGFVSEVEKVILLREAKVLVSPSHWEGFGIHVLESMASGTPVVISDRASLPEIGGEMAIYVDPEKPMSIAQGIERIINMSDLEYNKLATKVKKHADQFSWDSSASKLLNILEKIK